MKRIIKNLLSTLLLHLRLFATRPASLRFKKITPLRKSELLKEHATSIVIGNGPSLKKDIGTLLQMEDVDFFCVNHMAESEYFQDLKPNKHALFDAYFWADDAHEKLKKKRTVLFTALNERVSWKMFLYIPIYADLKFIQEQIKNTNIKIVQMQAIPVYGVKHKNLPHIFLQGKYAPPLCNVVIPAIYLSILAGYEYIELYGADLSFTEDVTVEQKTNRLLIEYKHFYSESTYEPLMKNPQRIDPFTMESLYETTYLTFYAHNLLNQMAQIKNIKITNKSSYSLIDAYARE